VTAVLSHREGGFYFWGMEKIDPHAEKHIAKKAEEMLRVAMRNKISSLGFKEHVSGPKIKLSDADAVAKTNLGKIGGENQNLKYYMNGLSLVMGQHGFVQHYGVNSTRENLKGRTRQTPKTTTYNFKNHVFNLPAKDYIDKAIQQSGVIPFVMENVTKVRSEEIFVHLKNFMEKE